MYRIFCVTAHPDDEAGNFGGTLAKLTRQGHQAYLVCLTSGEAARNRGGASNSKELMGLRAGELEASCRLLGIQEHALWRYPDGGLQRTDFFEAVGRLVGEIRSWKPDVVLTMGPEGAITGHPDHSMASLMATAAYHWAAQARYYPEQNLEPWQAQRLFYGSAVTRPEIYQKVHVPPPDVTVDIAAWVETKIAAFHVHATQSPLFERVDNFIRQANGTERFHLASAPLGFDRRVLKDDLLAGLEEKTLANPAGNPAL